MPRAFVSYSREDREAIAQLAGDLESIGISAWHDQHLTGGQRWWDNILANIRYSDIFIFALSPRSWESEACRSELHYVALLGKTILPVLVSDGINTNLLPPPLNEIQVTDYRRRDKEAALALIKAINMAPASPPLPDPLPKSPRVPISYLNNLKEQIDSPEQLTEKDQQALLFALKEGLQEGRSPTEVRDLLLMLRRRDDLLAKIGTKVDATLRSLDDRASGQPPHTAAIEAAAPADAPHGRKAQDASAVDTLRLCSKCDVHFDVGSMFCSACGAGLAQPGGAVLDLTLERSAPNGSKAKSRRFVCAANETPRLINETKAWLDAQGFDSQQMTTEAQSMLLQIKRRGTWRQFVGMSTSLNVVFHQTGSNLTVEIGAGKWIDKGAVGVVSIFILWPLAVTASYGAWEQMKLPDKIVEYIEGRVFH